MSDPYVPSLASKPGADRPPVRLVVALPTHETMEAGFAFDLQMMMARLGASVVADGIMDVRAFMIQGTLVHIARCDLVKDILTKTEGTHILFLDSDMRFPWQVATELLSANKDIVGCNYSTRKGAPRTTTFASLDLKEMEDVRRFLQPPAEAYTGDRLVKVDAVGMGICLIRRHVFEAIEYPWFETMYDRVNRRWVGEDVDFCQKAKAAGFDIWCDTHLSERIAHIGRFNYTMEHVRATNEVREAKTSLIVTPEG